MDDVVFKTLFFLFNAISTFMMIAIPVFIAGVALLVYKLNTDIKKFLSSPEFRGMCCKKNDIPAGAVSLPATSFGKKAESTAIYFSGSDVFLPQPLVTNQGGTALQQAKFEFLRLPLRDVTEITRLGVSAARGNIGYLLFTVPYLPKTIALFAGQGLGDPPPELFDTGKFLQLAQKQTSAPLTELGVKPFYKFWRFI